MKTAILIILFFLSGCSWFGDNRAVVPDSVDNRVRWTVLAPFIKNHFKTDMTVSEIVKNLTAEEAYWEYLQETNADR